MESKHTVAISVSEFIVPYGDLAGQGVSKECLTWDVILANNLVHFDNSDAVKIYTMRAFNIHDARFFMGTLSWWMLPHRITNAFHEERMRAYMVSDSSQTVIAHQIQILW